MGETSNPKTLKILAMETIIASHSCFNMLNNNNLRLPQRLFNELVEIGPGLIQMPKYHFLDDRFWFSSETEPFHKSLCYDQTYSKFFVVWVQQLIREKMEKYMPLVIHLLEIKFIIVINNNIERSYSLCTKCLKLHLNLYPITTNMFKVYRHYKHTCYTSLVLQKELREKVRSAKSWCNMCRQVPLFQVADHNVCCQIVGESNHQCPLHYPVDDDDPEFIYCLKCYGSGFRSFFDLKKEITF